MLMATTCRPMRKRSMLSPLAAIWPSLSRVDCIRGGSTLVYLPEGLRMAFLVRRWVLELEFNQGDLGGCVIGNTKLSSATWIPSITPMRKRTSKKMSREAQPGTTCGNSLQLLICVEFFLSTHLTHEWLLRLNVYVRSTFHISQGLYVRSFG